MGSRANPGVGGDAGGGYGGARTPAPAHSNPNIQPRADIIRQMMMDRQNPAGAGGPQMPGGPRPQGGPMMRPAVEPTVAPRGNFGPGPRGRMPFEY